MTDKNKTTVNSWTVLKRALAIFLPVAVILGTTAFSIYKKELKLESVSLEFDEKGIVNQQKEKIASELDHIAHNLLLLAREFELHMTKPGDFDPMELFGREFLIFSENMRVYDQIRLLDETGMEIIRANLNGGKPYLVPKDELQFKGDRYYFKEAFQLGNSEIYVSTFDLNIEEGKIEQPLKPVIRLATPVFYKDGQKWGIVVVNYLGEIILNSLKELAGKSSSRFMLINSDGFWLIGLTPDDEWGFMFEDRSEKRFDNANPEAWQEISENESGHFYNEDGMFTYKTIYPSIEAIRAAHTIKDISEAAKISIDSGGNYWKIVSYVPKDLLNVARYSLLWRFLLVYGLFAGLWAMLSWQLARINLHKKITQEKLEKSEASLTQSQRIAHLGNWEWDLKSHEAGWSDELFNILHLDSQKSHPGFRAFLKTVHPEDRAFVKKSFAEALAKKKPINIDHRIVLPDSSERVVVHDQSEIVFDESGEPIKVVGTIQDVTLPKKVEEALRKNNELLDTIRHAQDRFLAEGNTQPLFDKLLNDLLVLTESKYGFIGEVLYNSEGDPYLKTHAITDISWNDETRKFYKEKTPEGMEFCNLNSLFGAVMVTGEPVISNDPATDPRRSGIPEGHPSLDAFLGLPFCLESKLVGMVGIANRPGGYDDELVKFLEPFLKTCSNIIEAFKNNQKRLKAENDLLLFKKLMDQTKDGIFINNGETGYIIDVNESACKSMGYAREELVGKRVVDFDTTIPDDFSWEEHVKELHESGSMLFESGHRRKDGTEFPIEVNVREVEMGGKLYNLAVIRDITERKKTEEELSRHRDHLQDLVEERTHELGERIKELNCLYGIAKLFEEKEELDDVFLGVANITPLSWQYPEITCARIVFEESEFKTDNFIESKWKQSADIKVKERKVGTVEVFYLEERPDIDEGPFHKEERALIDEIASRIGTVVARRKAEEKLSSLEKALETTNMGVSIADLKGKIRYTNPADAKMHGYLPDELIGHDSRIFAPPELHKERTLKQFLATKEWKRESTNIRKDGSFFPVNLISDIILNASGEPSAVVTTCEDITGRKRVEEELKDSHDKLRQLASHIEAAREEERTSIARDIHDELGQVLTACKFDLAWTCKKLKKDQQPLIERLEESQNHIDNAINTVKRIATELRPTLLDDVGLLAAVEWQAKEFESRTGIKCNLSFGPWNAILTRDITTAVFRLFQEAMTNVARHSGATKVSACIKGEDGSLLLEVIDNGKGFIEKESSAPNSFGLIGMRERAGALSGETKISSTKGKGTTVFAKIPLNRE